MAKWTYQTVGQLLGFIGLFLGKAKGVALLAMANAIGVYEMNSDAVKRAMRAYEGGGTPTLEDSQALAATIAALDGAREAFKQAF